VRYRLLKSDPHSYERGFQLLGGGIKPLGAGIGVTGGLLQLHGPAAHFMDMLGDLFGSATALSYSTEVAIWVAISKMERL